MRKSFLVLTLIGLAGVGRAGVLGPGVATNSLPWPGGIIPYVFDGSVSAAQQIPYLDGIREWELAADVRFIPRTAEVHYLLLRYDPGAPDNTVTGAMPQVMTLNHLTRGQTAHEMGHSLGLEHEFTRTDRDDSILVLTNNIFAGRLPLWDLCSDCTLVGDYDFNSVMHFSATLFADPFGATTMQPLPPNEFQQPKLGNLALSTADRATAALLYGPGPALGPVVTHTRDGGPGSLRAAIYYAEDHPGTTITFNIPGTDPGFSNGVYTIHLTGHLPPLVAGGTTIDATTQPGYVDTPVVAISGARLAPEAGSTIFGLLVFGESNVVKGLAVHSFSDSGILIQYPEARSNRVASCHIGLGGSVFQGVGLFDGARFNTVGPDNVIGGNREYGVLMVGSNTTGNVVAGSRIGLEAAGTNATANMFSGVGIFQQAHHNTVGPNNRISGNMQYGVLVAESNTTGNLVVSNQIGVAISNRLSGVGIFDRACVNRVEGNILSGNAQYGVLLADAGTTGNVIAANWIGLDGGGSNALGNAFAGLLVANGTRHNRIADNIIAGQSGAGIFVADAGTRFNRFEGNTIGINAWGLPLDNSDGIIFSAGASTNVVGLDVFGVGEGNRIAHNRFGGVVLFDSAGSGNTIRGNTIYSNGFLGVDLVGGTNLGFGATANDPLDADMGPNGLQNFAVVTNAALWGPSTTIQGEFEAAPDRSYVVDLHANLSVDNTGFGEGQAYLGSVSVRTDGSGSAPFQFGHAEAMSNQFITANVTDVDTGDSSEFGPARATGLAAGSPLIPVLSAPMSSSFTNVVQFSMDAEPGWLVRLQTSTNLITWTDAGSYLNFVSPISISHPVHPATNRLYFRAVSP